MMGWDGGWSWFGVLWMVLFWGGLIALVVWGVRRSSAPQADRGRAMDILKERFARGEIDKQEFEEGKQELRRP